MKCVDSFHADQVVYKLPIHILEEEPDEEIKESLSQSIKSCESSVLLPANKHCDILQPTNWQILREFITPGYLHESSTA